MKLYSPGNCFCASGYYWAEGKSQPNPGETGFATETIYGFCTGSTFVITPSQSSPLGVDVDGKKAVYRRGATQEIWTRDFAGTTALLYAVGDLYDNAMSIRDITIHETTGFGVVELAGVAPFTNSVASFNVASGNFVNGPYGETSYGTVDENGDVYYVRTVAGAVECYKNSSVYATLTPVGESPTQYFYGSMIAANTTLYIEIARTTSNPIVVPVTWYWGQVNSGGASGADITQLYRMETLGSPVDEPTASPIDNFIRTLGKSARAKGYYNFSTDEFDLPIFFRGQMNDGDSIAQRNIIRFNISKSRNSDIVSNWRFDGGGDNTFVFKNG